MASCIFCKIIKGMYHISAAGNTQRMLCYPLGSQPTAIYARHTLREPPTLLMGTLMSTLMGSSIMREIDID